MHHFLQPIHENEAGLINTFSGILLDYNNLTPEMIRLEDMSKGVSNICRFGGQIFDFYSVAQHTLLVWYLATDRLKAAALLHDLQEAYLGDVVKPLKVLLGDAYRKYERRFEEVIFAKYHVDIALLEEIKIYDMQALEIENNYFRHQKQDLIFCMNEINTALSFMKPHDQLLMLLESNFLQYEISNPKL